MTIAPLLYPFQAFKNFEHLARQDDERMQQEREEKMTKREDTTVAAAVAAESVKVPTVVKEVEISTVEPEFDTDDSNPTEPQQPVTLEEKSEDINATVVSPMAACSVETQPAELPK